MKKKNTPWRFRLSKWKHSKLLAAASTPCQAVKLMKDSELRGFVLQEFYAKRRGGDLGIRVQNFPRLEVPCMEDDDLLRISDQLGQYGLIEWHDTDDGAGKLMAGVGKITAAGIDVIEGEQKAPLPIQIDHSHHIQNIQIEGQHGGIQVAGAHSNQQQSIEQEIGKIISAIDGANVSEAAKQEAKGLLVKFLQSSAAGAILGPAADALLKHCAI